MSDAGASSSTEQGAHDQEHQAHDQEPLEGSHEQSYTAGQQGQQKDEYRDPHQLSFSPSGGLSSPRSELSSSPKESNFA